jgi:hypothetical protein
VAPLIVTASGTAFIVASQEVAGADDSQLLSEVRQAFEPKTHWSECRHCIASRHDQARNSSIQAQ